MSGSPIQNSLTELWSLFDFVFPGKLGVRLRQARIGPHVAWADAYPPMDALKSRPSLSFRCSLRHQSGSATTPTVGGPPPTPGLTPRPNPALNRPRPTPWPHPGPPSPPTPTLPPPPTLSSDLLQSGWTITASNVQLHTAYRCAVILRDLIGPFLLRRLKVDVAKDLPKKTEQVLFCRLTPMQQDAYVEFVHSDEVTKVR